MPLQAIDQRPDEWQDDEEETGQPATTFSPHGVEKQDKQRKDQEDAMGTHHRGKQSNHSRQEPLVLSRRQKCTDNQEQKRSLGVDGVKEERCRKEHQAPERAPGDPDAELLEYQVVEHDERAGEATIDQKKTNDFGRKPR